MPATPVERVVETVLPTRHGVFRLVGFRGGDGTEHVSLSMGITDADAPARRRWCACTPSA